HHKADLLEGMQLSSPGKKPNPTGKCHPPTQQEPLDLEHEYLFADGGPRTHRTRDTFSEPAFTTWTVNNRNVMARLVTQITIFGAVHDRGHQTSFGYTPNGLYMQGMVAAFAIGHLDRMTIETLKQSSNLAFGP
ncbi:MAG: hypothetical protein ABIS18_07185, partial [Actinomycetota bacterium]